VGCPRVVERAQVFTAVKGSAGVMEEFDAGGRVAVVFTAVNMGPTLCRDDESAN
jgi:hypothetical protein